MYYIARSSDDFVFSADWNSTLTIKHWIRHVQCVHLDAAKCPIGGSILCGDWFCKSCPTRWEQ